MKRLLFFLFSCGIDLRFPATFYDLLADLRVTTYRTVMYNMNAEKLSFIALYGITWPRLRFVWSRDQQCHEGNPDAQTDITSNLPWTFLFFLPSAPCLLIYSNLRTSCSQRIFLLNIFTLCSHPPTIHSPFAHSLSLLVVILIYFRSNFLVNYSKMATAVIRG